MSAMAAHSATSDWKVVGGPLLASPIFWALYMAAPLSLLKYFAKREQIDQHASGGDTKNIRYDDVTAKTGFELHRYECPLLQPGEDAWVGVDKVSHHKAHSTETGTNDEIKLFRVTKMSSERSKRDRNHAHHQGSSTKEDYTCATDVGHV
ncbi:hypothetical protein AB1Y20_020383 [Prymnesium parvum]|uniref:Uncharacterized protein n=1 Tax=Prymnesium parvum TaxID=97485 RepID=A0AB34JXG0_PRYPA